MSLLDTFALIFETDADDAADDVDRLSGSLDDASTSGDKTSKSLNKLSSESKQSSAMLGGLAKSLGTVIAAYVSLHAFTQAATATDTVGKFTETLGLNIEEIDAWGAAVERNGGSADSFRGAVDALNTALGDVALGGGGDIADTLGRLGVSALDSTGRIKQVTQILPELADAFQNITKRESVAFGRKLGLDQGTILLLQQGRNAVQGLVEQQRQLGGRTEEGYKAAAEFNDEIGNTQRIFVGMSDSMNQKVLPVLSKLLRGFQDIAMWMDDHSDVVEGFFLAAATAISYFYLPAIIAAATSTWAAIAPFLAMAGVVIRLGAAIGLLYEDVKAYLGGQESFIGKLAAKYEWFGTIVDSIIGFISGVMNSFSQAGEKMADNLSNSINMLGDVFSVVFDAIGVTLGDFDGVSKVVTEGVAGYFKLLGSIIHGVLQFIASPIETTKQAISELFSLIPKLESVKNMAGDAWESVKGWFGGDDDNPPAEIKKLQQQSITAIDMSASANANPILSGATSNNRSVFINQTNSFSSQVDARGMDREQAIAVFNENRDREIAATKGRLDDGIMY